MRVLAIDTATQVCGAALVEEETLVADFRLNQRNIHNEKLVLSIERLVMDAGWTLQELHGVAVSIGPGSFTGLRIGLAVAKGLCYSLAIPLACVNTLDALAVVAPVAAGEIGVVLKAREGEAYFAKYNKQQGNAALVGNYEIVGMADVDTMISDGMTVFGNPKMVPNQECILSEPAVIAHLGYRKFIQGQVTDPAAAEPFYLQDFEVRRRKRSHVA
jgi:tRNA threonylcarbamoyladenosine biosynthesis protein TsaB